MKQTDEDSLKKTGEIFKTLGDKTRIRILLTLYEGKKCVHEIAEITDQELSNVSHHLRKLREKGLVDFQKKGRHKYYRIVDKHVLKMLREGIDHARD